MFGKEFLFIIKSIKKTIFFIMKILIKIGFVWIRILINHKRYKKDYILHLVNKNKNHKFSGKNFYLSKSIKKTIFIILKILIKIGNVRVRTLVSH